jgi:hypothetical protein
MKKTRKHPNEGRHSVMQDISHEHRSTISTKRERVERRKDHKESAKEEQAIGQSTLRKGTGRKEDQYPFLLP